MYIHTDICMKVCRWLQFAIPFSRLHLAQFVEFFFGNFVCLFTYQVVVSVCVLHTCTHVSIDGYFHSQVRTPIPLPCPWPLPPPH